MSWIQENRFVAGLGGITAVAAIGLIAFAVSAGSGYSTAKEEYDKVSGEIDSITSGRLYPSDDNLSAKEKAVREYKESVGKLTDAFNKFKAATPPNIEPADFNTALAKARETAAKAITDNKGEVPADFFDGFELYKETAVKKEATGILTYELEAISQLMAGLAASGPVKILNIHRPKLEEEDGKVFDTKDKMLRALPFEIAFNCKEDALRKFLSSLDDSGKYYYVIRSMRVSNEKVKAPTAADAAFKTEEEAAPAPGGDSGIGGGGFVLPGEEPAAPTPAPEAAPGAEAPAAGGADEKILQQVLGSERINVFLRLDIIQFYPDQTIAGGKPAPAPKSTPANN